MSEPAAEFRPPVAGTIVARNYLPAAKVLASTYLAHHPDHEFIVMVTDGVLDTDASPDYRVVGPEWLDIDTTDYLRMATSYTVIELANAIKPSFLRRLLTEAPVAIYLNADIQVFAPFPEVAQLAASHDIVLTPHFLEPFPKDDKEPQETAIMGTGIFDLGFLAVGRGAGRFLDFWSARLRHDSLIAPESQLFTDQRWVDQVPVLFRHTVLRDPGFNVAYWNVHERPLAKAADGTVTVGGQPLRFFHFSGYRPERRWLLSQHAQGRPRVMLSKNPELHQLCDSYRDKLLAAGYQQPLEMVKYGFDTLPDGTKLTVPLRRLFRNAWIEAERPDKEQLLFRRATAEVPPHPFGADNGLGFQQWLSSPSSPPEEAAGLNRFLMQVWAHRPDLQQAFPWPCGVDSAGYRLWCQTFGVQEKMVPAWALPGEPHPVEPPVDAFGVNIAGYLTAELGLGEMGRIVHRAVQLTGMPVASVVEEHSLSCRTALSGPEDLGRPRFPVSILSVNGDQTELMLASYPEVGYQRYRIGLWAWELEDFPKWQREGFEHVDEIWTVSDFCQKAIAKHSPVPVKVIPVPVLVPDLPPRPDREPGKPVQFFFAFDFNSSGQRKNPWGLVTAFQRAFPGRDDVRLVIKATNSQLHSYAAERLRLTIGDDPRIQLLERYLSVDELNQLYADSDCYVSLHRSEGFGLTVAEAMARGMPVISTDYSSTTEFFDHRVGWPISARLTKVGPGWFPYHEDALWADPDLGEAARAMREVADNPAEAARRGAAARDYILRTRSMAAAAEWMHTELRSAYQTWRTRQGIGTATEATVDATTSASAGEVLEPLTTARQALHWRADTASPSRFPLAPALRRAVLRALDHYDVHQRKVVAAVVDGTQGAVSRIVRRLDSAQLATDRRLAQLTAQVERVERSLTRAERRERARPERLHGLADDLAGLRAQQVELSAEQQDLGHRVTAGERHTTEMLLQRDRRFEAAEHELRRLEQDVAVLHEVAELAHVPVPDHTEVVVCDAGALLVSRDEVVLPALAQFRSWERGEAVLMAQLAGTGMVLDIGAHVGYHTLRLLRSCPDIAEVVAVEANPETVELLRRNLAVNLPAETAKLVTVLSAAAWNTDGRLHLVQGEPNNSGDLRVSPAPGAGHSVEIPAVRLDSQLAGRQHRVTLIKTDLQGRDHRALAGLTEVLESDRPDIVCEFCPEMIEELGDSPRDVLAAYRSWGYTTQLVTTEGIAKDTPSDIDAVVSEARQAVGGFISLLLRPDRPA